MTGRSNTIVPRQLSEHNPVSNMMNMPGASHFTAHLGPTTGTQVTYAQINRPLIMNTSTSYVPQDAYSLNDFTPFNVNPVNNSTFSCGQPRETPPVSINSFPFYHGTHVNHLPVSMSEKPVYSEPIIPVTTQQIQWNQVQMNTTPIVTMNHSTMQNVIQQPHKQSTLYHTVFSGNSANPNLTRSSSIGSINSYTRKWVDNQNKLMGNHEHVYDDIADPREIQQDPDDKPQNYMLRDEVLCNAFKALTTRTSSKDLPTFTGEIREWPLFYSEYVRTTNELNIPPSENLRRLGKALDKKARQTVLPLLSDVKNLDIIIKVLEKNFGQPQWVIATLIDDLKNFPNLKDDNIELFRDFFNKVMNTCATIKNMNGQAYLNNPELMLRLVQKLPPFNKSIWGHFKAGQEVTLEHFCLWLEEELDAQFANFSPFPQKGAYDSHGNNFTNNYRGKFQNRGEISRKATTFHHTETPNTSTSKPCVCCKATPRHPMFKCDKFLKFSVDEKREFVSKHGLCFSCLQTGHGVDKCNSKGRCKECGAKHHTVLHKEVVKKPEDNQQPPKKETSLYINENVYTNTLLRCGKVKLKGKNGPIEVFALFDDGSTASQIEDSLAQELQLDGPVAPITYC